MLIQVYKRCIKQMMEIRKFSILKKNSYEISIISGEGNAAIQTMAKKFGIVEIHQNIRKKIAVLKNIVEKYGFDADQVLVGDAAYEE